MTRHTLLAPLLGIALFALPGSASAQLPFFNLFAPFTNTQVRPATNAQYGNGYYNNTNYNNGYHTGYNNQAAAPYYGGTNTCPNGVCTVNRPTAAPYYRPSTYPVSSNTSLNCQTDAYGRCITPGHAHYGQVVGNNAAANCRPDAYGRCTNPSHPHYGQNVGGNLSPVGGYSPNSMVNLYRDRDFLPVNYNTPANSPYYGTQLR